MDQCGLYRTAPLPTGVCNRHHLSLSDRQRPDGANCLSDCGTEATPPVNKPDYSSLLWRGSGHAWVGSTKQGVNGLYEMGANVWEWVELGAATSKPRWVGLEERALRK